jgi:hypothetical protein
VDTILTLLFHVSKVGWQDAHGQDAGDGQRDAGLDHRHAALLAALGLGAVHLEFLRLVWKEL